MTRLFAALMAFILFTEAGTAETRALLIGVSDYDDTAGIADLRGPANDVRLLQDVLRGRGVSDITVLADGVGGSAVPTRAAILSEFAELTARSASGDFVYIHFSGHGTRQADLNGDETDGLDEVFLPADITRAKAGASTIPNALVDDDIGLAVTQLRAKGVDVWLVLDACHSGSGVRAAAPGTAVRFVDPGALGVSLPQNRVPEETIVEVQSTETGGSFVAFYSARSSELAREVNLAREGEPDAWYGLFTAKLASRLQSAGAISFRQLFQAVLSDMNSDSVPGAARLQTPSWEGALIDATLFGGADTAGLRRFAVTDDALAAGLVHGMPDGTLVGLVADATDAPDAVIGYAQTEDVSATQSYLRPVAADCVPLGTRPCPSAGDLPATARFAQVIALPLDLTLTLSVPRDLTGAALPMDHPAQIALSGAVEAVNARGGQTIKLSDRDFAVDVAWDGDALWFGPRAVIGRSPVGLAWQAGEADLDRLLTRIAHAEHMARMLGAVTRNGASLSPNPVNVSVKHTSVDVNDLAPLNREMSIRRECGGAHAALDDSDAVPLTASADLKQCDRLGFSVQGKGAGARDVNRVYIDSQYCVQTAYERIDDAAAARPLGPDMFLCSDCPSGYSAGEERLFVITTEAVSNAEALNLQGLIENCGPAGGTRGTTASNQALDFLEQLAQRPGTRGAIGGFGLADIWVEAFNWRVLPRREAYIRAGRIVEE